jgi:hypothetical protein
MDMDWMQPGNNSKIHPTRRRFYISLRKSDRKKEKNEKKKKTKCAKEKLQSTTVSSIWVGISFTVR